MRDRDQACAFVQQSVEVGRVEPHRVATHRPDTHLHAVALEADPRTDVRLVVGLADDDLVTAREARLHCTREAVDQVGGGRADHDLVRVGGVQEPGECAARRGNDRAGRGRSRVARAVLHVVVTQVRGDSVDHRLGDLRTTRVVHQDLAGFERREPPTHPF